MKAHGFRISFTPLGGVLSTFPSRYLYTIGLTGVFSLAGWARRIHTGLLVSRATQDNAAPNQRSRTGLSPSLMRLSRLFRSASTCAKCAPTTPAQHRYRAGLGCSPVARHYWGNHCYFLLLGVLRCFSSPGSPHRKKIGDSRPTDGWVVPFGNPRINGHLHLPEAYRSLSRPSSPP